MQYQPPDLQQSNFIIILSNLWFGHVERSSGGGRTACDIQIEGRRGGREAQANMEETDGERLL